MDNIKEIEWLYFLDNEEWYKFDYDKNEYVLTDKATPKAKKTYEKYLEQKKTKIINGRYIV